MTASLTKKQIADLEDLAAQYRNHIAKIRIDFPEAADARRQDLHEIYRKIATARRQAGGHHGA